MESGPEHIETAGMHAYIDSQMVSRDDFWASTADAGLWVGVVAAGELETTHSGLGKQIWTANSCHAFWSEGDLETEHRPLKDDRLTGVFVHVPKDAVEGLLGEDVTSIARRFSQRPMLRRCDAAVRAISWQMLGCSLKGPQRRLHLTSRSFDLLARVLDENDAQQTGANGARAQQTLSTCDIEKIHNARSLLLTDLKNPPSTADLAVHIGMNARKLNDGFRNLFGTTAYALVKQNRLERARALLEAGGLSISQIAYSVGYEPAHFSTAFRKRFGVSPATYKAP